MKCKY